MSTLYRMPAVLLLAVLSHPGISAADPPAPKGVEKLWADLGCKDPVTAEQVMAQLAARPTQAAFFLGEHLRPVAPPKRCDVVRWLAELDSDDYAAREQATQQLKKAGEVVESALKEALDQSPSPEARGRIKMLLARVKAERLSPSPERRRRVRAIEVLERIGNGKAREVLTHLAQGAAEAQLTVEARAALERLGPAR